MAVTKRVRFEVFRRDNFTCRYCHATNKELTIDHVIPQALGGSDKPDNLVACCKDCNSGKTSVSPDEPLVADVQEKALALRNALHEAMDTVSTSVENENDYINHVGELWETITETSATTCFFRPNTWLSSARYWFGLNVPFDIIEYAFTIIKEKVRAHTLYEKASFSYASGIIGNKMEEAVQLAYQRLEAEEEEAVTIKHCWHCQHCWAYGDDLDADPSIPDRKDCELYYPKDDTSHICNICHNPDCVYVIGFFAGIDSYKAMKKQHGESENTQNG